MVGVATDRQNSTLLLPHCSWLTLTLTDRQGEQLASCYGQAICKNLSLLRKDKNKKNDGKNGYLQFD